jgi:hypothetical protein
MIVGAHHDDSTIEDDAVLWRRIFPGWWKYDFNQRDWRPTSQAFGDDPNGGPMSAYLAEAHPGGAGDVLKNHEDFGLVALTAGFLRSQGLIIYRNEMPGPAGHVEVAGPKTDGIRNRMAKAAQWVIRPAFDIPPAE